MSRLDEVFGISREIPENYVVRASVDSALVNALARDEHIVIFGSSKQGKTCLRKYNLRDSEYLVVTCSNTWSLRDLHSAILKMAGYTVDGSTTLTVNGAQKVKVSLRARLAIGPGSLEGEANRGGGNETITTTETPLELDASDVNDIIYALMSAGSPKFIVLEDFHYLKEETQRDFAVALKAFHEQSEYSFIVVGVWLDENRLVQHNGDLAGRVVSINADIWTPNELTEVVTKGEGLLNVRFAPTFTRELVEGCFDSVWVVQQCCRQACDDANVFDEWQGREPKVVDGDAKLLIRQAVDGHSARYNGFLVNFAEGFQQSQLEMYRWLLLPVLKSNAEELERGISYSQIKQELNASHPQGPINAGNITQALQYVASLQVGSMGIKPIILDYDQTSRRLKVVDRSFIVWMQNQPRNELLDMAGLPVD